MLRRGKRSPETRASLTGYGQQGQQRDRPRGTTLDKTALASSHPCPAFCGPRPCPSPARCLAGRPQTLPPKNRAGDCANVALAVASVQGTELGLSHACPRLPTEPRSAPGRATGPSAAGLEPRSGPGTTWRARPAHPLAHRLPSQLHRTPRREPLARAGQGRGGGGCLSPPPPPAWQQYPASPKASSAPPSSCRYGQGAYRTPAGSHLCLPRAPALLDSSKVPTICPLKTSM